LLDVLNKPTVPHLLRLGLVLNPARPFPR